VLGKILGVFCQIQILFFNAELAIFSSGFAKKADTFLSFVDQFNQSNVLTYLKLLEVELGETEEAIMNSQEEIVNYLYKCAEEIGITFNILRTNYLHYFSYETLSHDFQYVLTFFKYILFLIFQSFDNYMTKDFRNLVNQKFLGNPDNYGIETDYLVTLWNVEIRTLITNFLTTEPVKFLNKNIFN